MLSWIALPLLLLGQVESTTPSPSESLEAAPAAPVVSPSTESEKKRPTAFYDNGIVGGLLGATLGVAPGLVVVQQFGCAAQGKSWNDMCALIDWGAYGSSIYGLLMGWPIGYRWREAQRAAATPPARFGRWQLAAAGMTTLWASLLHTAPLDSLARGASPQGLSGARAAQVTLPLAAVSATFGLIGHEWGRPKGADGKRARLPWTSRLAAWTGGVVLTTAMAGTLVEARGATDLSGTAGLLGPIDAFLIGAAIPGGIYLGERAAMVWLE